jgi:hypothetical protein
MMLGFIERHDMRRLNQIGNGGLDQCGLLPKRSKLIIGVNHIWIFNDWDVISTSQYRLASQVRRSITPPIQYMEVG